MSETRRIREILPDVMQDIQRRTKLNHQAKVLSAVSDYYQNRWQGRPRSHKRAKGGQKDLYGQPRIEIL